MLEARRLLAHIGIDPDFGNESEAPAGATKLLETLPDGKILAAEGGLFTSSPVSRLNADGTLDRSFNDALAGSSATHAVVSGSRVILARVEHPLGLERPIELQLRAVRLADGSVDTSFGDGGIVHFKPKSLVHGYRLYYSQVTSMTATADGGVLLGLYHIHRDNVAPQDPDTNRDVLYKFNAQGQPDVSFGDHGGLIPAEGVRPDDGAPLLTALPDGGFLMINFAQSHAQLTRHRPDGTVDDSFGNGGSVALATISGPTQFESYDPPVVQPDGKLLIPITSHTNSGTPGFLARLNADGSVDSSFGTNGLADVEGPDGFSDIELDPSGRILAFAGPALFRLTPDGKPDPTFDDDGRVDLHPFDEGSGQIAVDASGGVLVGQRTRVVRLIERDPIVRASNGVVYVDGTDGNDTITAAHAGDQVTVSLNGQSVSFAAGDVSGFQIDTRKGDLEDVEVTVDRNTAVAIHGKRAFVRTAGGDDRITGGFEADTIHAGAGNDVVMAEGSNDSVDGGDGDDKIYGGQGDDTIAGGAGRDWLYGDSPFGPFFFSGADSITGGDGDDWLYGDEHLNVGANDTLDGGAGDNVLNSNHLGGVTISGNVLRFDGTDGADDISIWPQAFGSPIISVDGVQQSVDLSAIQEVRFIGRGGDDFLRLNPRLWWAATIEGGAGDDSLFGASAGDDLRGGDGDDQLYGHGGNDMLDGGLGADLMLGYAGRDQVDYSTRSANLVITVSDALANDGEAGEGDLVHPDVERIRGGTGNDVMIGGNGVNLFYGSDGHDTLAGGGRADRLLGEGGDDRLIGGDGDDYIEAGAGHDTLHGDDGADALFGLSGNDQLFSAGDDTKDTVRGGPGFDLAHFDELDDVLATELAI